MNLKTGMSTIVGLISLIGMQPSWAENHLERAVQDSGGFSTSASGSVAHGIAASGLLTSAAIAIPLIATGELLGAAATNITHSSPQANSQKLQVTEETLSIMPPNQALAKPNSDNKAAR